MLKAKFFVLDSGEIIGFEISGHSGYASHGSDIVCAAVSSASYMAVNTMSDIIMADLDLTVDENVGYMKVVMTDKKDLARCSDILKGFKMHLLLLEEMYSKNIKVSYSEVRIDA